MPYAEVLKAAQSASDASLTQKERTAFFALRARSQTRTVEKLSTAFVLANKLADTNAFDYRAQKTVINCFLRLPHAPPSRSFKSPSA